MPSLPSHVARPRLAATLPLRLAIVGGSLLMALCAHISLPRSFSPVPSTMQTFGLLVLGMTLGPTAGAAAMVLYLLEGAAGMPVFSPQGLPGLAHLAGPTAGFLFSYPLAAALAAWIYRRLRPHSPRILAALAGGAAGLIPVFALGAAWLVAAHLVPEHRVMQLAVLPFLSGEAVKLLLAAVLVAALDRSRHTAQVTASPLL